MKEDEEFDEERYQIIKRVHEMKLRDLTVGDILAIVNMFHHRAFGPSERDLRGLEKISEPRGLREHLSDLEIVNQHGLYRR
jgi:hypothetical protein